MLPEHVGKERIGIPKFLVPIRLYIASLGFQKISLLIGALLLFSLVVGWITYPRYPRGICVFDFENVLVNSTDYQPFDDAFAVQKKCVDLGHEVSIFRSKIDAKTHTILKSLIKYNFGQFWPDALIHSNALQFRNDASMVDPMLSIANYYEIDSRCMVFIANAWKLEKYSESVGAAFHRVSEKSGVTLHDIDKALGKMKEKCESKEKNIVKNCSDDPPDDVFTCQRQKAWGKCGESWMTNNCCYSCYNCDGTGLCQKKNTSSIDDKKMVNDGIKESVINLDPDATLGD